MATTTGTSLEILVEVTKGTSLEDMAGLVCAGQEVAKAAAYNLRDALKTLKGRVDAYEEERRTLAFGRMRVKNVLWCRDCEYLKPHDGFKLLMVSHLDAIEKPIGLPTLCFVCFDCSQKLRELSADHKAMAFITTRLGGNLEVWRAGKRESFTGEYKDEADPLPIPIPPKLAAALELPPALEFLVIVGDDVFAYLSITFSGGETENLQI